jgi:hypothetical protein
MSWSRGSGLKTSVGLGGAFLLAVLGGMLAGQSATLAHSNGHESRTPAQCERLPGTAREGERAHCLECVSRPKPHHFHPDYPPGQRCRPDDGKP